MGLHGELVKTRGLCKGLIPVSTWRFVACLPFPCPVGVAVGSKWTRCAEQGSPGAHGIWVEGTHRSCVGFKSRCGRGIPPLVSSYGWGQPSVMRS
eukprot:scaffold17_cov354-Pavlova_lutheri.AAC.11